MILMVDATLSPNSICRSLRSFASVVESDGTLPWLGLDVLTEYSPTDRLLGKALSNQLIG